LDEAIACYKKGIELDPKKATVHNTLGALLCDMKRDYDGAIACFRKAIELDAKYAWPHTNLGVALYGKGQLNEAIACHKKAIELDPKNANAHGNLGVALAGKGQVDEAIASTKKGIELDPKDANARYNMACFSALAAAGARVNEPPLDDAARAKLRGQALESLKAALALYTKQLEGDPARAQQMMRHWQKDTDLASIRDQAALAKLPAEEQKAFTQLWADVAALLKKANPGPPPGAKPAEKTPELAPAPRPA